MTYIPVGGGAGEMAVGGKNGQEVEVWVVTWVMGGATHPKSVLRTSAVETAWDTQFSDSYQL